jgi:hypothetical protein
VDLVYVSDLQDGGTHGGQVDPLRGLPSARQDPSRWRPYAGYAPVGIRRVSHAPSALCQRLEHPVGCGMKPRALPKRWCCP